MLKFKYFTGMLKVIYQRFILLSLFFSIPNWGMGNVNQQIEDLQNDLTNLTTDITRVNTLNKLGSLLVEGNYELAKKYNQEAHLSLIHISEPTRPY